MSWFVLSDCKGLGGNATKVFKARTLVGVQKQESFLPVGLAKRKTQGKSIFLWPAEQGVAAVDDEIMQHAAIADEVGKLLGLQVILRAIDDKVTFIFIPGYCRRNR